MKTKKIVCIIFLIGIMISCTEQIDEPIINDSTIIGLWVQDTSGDYSTINKYAKKEEFEIEVPGLKFSENGDFIFRDKCSCPESKVENYYGSFSLLNDSILKINYYADSIFYERNVKIIELTTDTLKVSFK